MPAPVAGAAPLRFVFDKESWIEVRDRSNKVIFSQRNAVGSEQQVAGEGPFSLVIGYAPGVRLFWRGQPIDLAPHTRGDVARLVLE
jgi:cytoskeleton protein RodZ